MGFFPDSRLRPTTTITPFSEEALGAAIAGAIITVPGSGTYTQNKAYFFPFHLAFGRVLTKMFHITGATANGNMDVGVYDSDFRLIISSGAVAQGTANTLQEFELTDTLLNPGNYWMACSGSSATGTWFRLAPTDELALTLPLYSTASAHPLPASPTAVLNVDSTPFIPVFGVSFHPAGLI